MRVALVLGGVEEGGLEKHFVELCNGLSECGVHVVAIAHSKYGGRFSPSVRFEAVNLARGRRNPWALLRLYIILRRSQVDLIHAHAGKAMAMVASLLPFLRIPAVGTIHNVKSKTRYLARFAGLIAVSSSVIAGVKHNQVCIIHNGIPLPTHPDDRDLQALRCELAISAGPIVLSIGRLVSAKGFDVLLSAWQQVNSSATLIIAGDGPERHHLEAQTNALGLNARVRFLGARTDALALIALADCLVIASRNEGGPYTLPEALLLGCPVLSTYVGMVPDYLPENFLCPVESIEELADLLQHHLDDLPALLAAQQTLFNRAEEELTLPAMLRKNIRFYEKVVEQ